MLAALLATVAMTTFAATPQAAALRAVYNTHAVPFVQRINVAGRYATVLVGAGMMEGSAVSSPILVKRFPFGWQPLALLSQSCDLYGQVPDKKIAAALMTDMPEVKIEQRLCPSTADTGPVNDIAAIRKSMRGPLVPYVAVSGNWASAQWYGAGGGQSIFNRRRGTWKLVAGGGGALGIGDMPNLGVPQSAWCALRIYNARCKH